MLWPTCQRLQNIPSKSLPVTFHQISGAINLKALWEKQVAAVGVKEIFIFLSHRRLLCIRLEQLHNASLDPLLHISHPWNVLAAGLRRANVGENLVVVAYNEDASLVPVLYLNRTKRNREKSRVILINQSRFLLSCCWWNFFFTSSRVLPFFLFFLFLQSTS